MHQIAQARRKPARQLLQRRLHCVGRLHGVGAGREINTDRHPGAAVDPRLTVEILRADLDAGDVRDPQHRAIQVRPQHDVAELLRRSEPALRLYVELELLLIADWPRADAADRRLNALSADRGDDIGRRQIEAGEPLRIKPDPHRIVHFREQAGLADPRRAGNRVEDVDDGVVGDEQRVLLAVCAIEHDELQDRRRLLLHHQALLLDFGRQLRQRGLNTVVDVDGVDVGIGAERKRNRQGVAAVVAAGRLHIERAVDTDHLRFQRLRDAALDHFRGGAGKYA